MKRLLAAMLSCSLSLTGCSYLSSNDKDQDSLIRAGDRVQAAGDPDSAIGVYKSALEKTPGHKLPVYLKLGEAYMSAGRIDEAKRTYEEALPLDEHDEVKKQLGRLYLSIGEPDSAIPIFENILSKHRDDVKALNGLGVANDLNRKHPAAQDYYRQALSINENNDEVKSNLGLSLAFDGKYEEALKLLQPLGEALGASSRQRHNLALVYALSGNQANAEKIYAKDMDAQKIRGNLHLIYKTKPEVTLDDIISRETSESNAEGAESK